ncbi:hypothetical protein [Phaeobacter italicus]|jgi:hypothetical protein|uniref:hypothetical protein n=1 Tax=Phaeobacter italicus TaxID=481446 RepID=UPI002FDEBA90
MTEQAKKHIRKLGGGRSEPADYKIARMALWPEAGTTLKEIMHPQYFANYLNSFREGMELSILSDCKELDVRLRVLAFDNFQAHIRILNVYAAPDADEYFDELEEGSGPTNEIGEDGLPEGLEVTWGGAHKWRVVNKASKEVMEYGFTSKAMAEERAKELAL